MPRGLSEIFNEAYPESGTYGTLLTSLARTTSQTGNDITNPRARGVKVVVDITASSSPSNTITIQGKDVVSGKYYTLLASAALTGNGTTILTVFPGAPVSANVSANDGLPAVWRVIVTAGNSNSATYSIGYSYLF